VAGPECRPGYLEVLPVHDPANGVPGSLRTLRGDGHLGADQSVGQRRLPVFGRPTKHTKPERNSAMMIVLPLGAVGVNRLSRTVPIRTRPRWSGPPSACSRRPCETTSAPGSGTRPIPAPAGHHRVDVEVVVEFHAVQFANVLDRQSRRTRKSVCRPSLLSEPFSSASYSSAISPTISSSTSSMLTRPAIPARTRRRVAPCGCDRAAFHAAAHPTACCPARTLRAASPAPRDVPTAAFPPRRYADKVFQVHTPTMSSTFSPITGMRE